MASPPAATVPAISDLSGGISYVWLRRSEGTGGRAAARPRIASHGVIVRGGRVDEATDLPIGNSPANIAKCESCEKRQALATTAALLSCAREVSSYLSGSTEPKAMWDTLAEKLGSAFSFGRRVTIGKKFDNARPKTGESTPAYLSRLKDTRVQIAGTEGAISVRSFCITSTLWLRSSTSYHEAGVTGSLERPPTPLNHG